MQLDCIFNETVVRNYGTFSNTMEGALSPVHHNQTDDCRIVSRLVCLNCHQRMISAQFVRGMYM